MNGSLVSDIIDIKLNYPILYRTEVLCNKIEEIVGRCFLSWKSNKISKYVDNLKRRKNFFCPDFAFEVSMLLFYFIWRQLKFVKYLTVVVDQDISQPLYFVGQMLNQYFIGIIP